MFTNIFQSSTKFFLFFGKNVHFKWNTPAFKNHVHDCAQCCGTLQAWLHITNSCWGHYAADLALVLWVPSKLALAFQWHDVNEETTGCLPPGARLLMKVIIKDKHTGYHEVAGAEDSVGISRDVGHTVADFISQRLAGAKKHGEWGGGGRGGGTRSSATGTIYFYWVIFSSCSLKQRWKSRGSYWFEC